MPHSHNIHILLGNVAEQNISHIKEYIIKYGDEYIDTDGRVASDFLQLLLWNDDGYFYIAKKKAIQKNVFISGIEDEYYTELVKCENQPTELDKDGLLYFFRKLFNGTVNMQTPGDGKLHVCIHVPTYDTAYWEKTESIIDAIENSGKNYTVDLMLISSELAYLQIDDTELLADKARDFEETSANTLKRIIEVKKSVKYRCINSLILVSNTNENGISLNLNKESYANIMGEYALATTAYCTSIFPLALIMSTQEHRPVLGLGISMVHFDRFYFVQYMLHRAYSYILEREGINRDKVGINRMALIVKGLLDENIDIFTRVVNQEIMPRVDRNMPEKQIIAELEPQIKNVVRELKEKFLEYINCESLGDEVIGLPEKRAILALLLGEDDTILDGYIVDGEEQPIVDDCRQEVLDIFVNANNCIVGTDIEILDSQNTRAIQSYAALSGRSTNSVETAKNKLDKIKKTRNDIRTSADYIRSSEKQLEALEKSLKTKNDSRTRLTENGFEFEGKTYCLMPKNIEVPLDETYTPKQDRLPYNVDLRKQFTPVKNQGELSSCSAFAIVGIYEYILKKNCQKDTRLSELFSYYNARERQGSDDKATSLYDNIMGIGEKGICLEEKFPYTTDIDKEPGAEAYDDAQTRKINKALNVERDVEHIKSAVSEGYPVAISLCLYDSFSSAPAGFVPHPSTEEVESGEKGYHAMIVCGYSDKDKVFIVRNSWGDSFGDKGYCYIPYSYIGNTKFLACACIITEISIAEFKVQGSVGNTPISFNEADSEVLAAKLRILIEEEKIFIENQKTALKALRDDYFDLVTRAGNPTTQQTITKGAEELCRHEIAELNRRKEALISERVKTLAHHDKSKKTIWKFALLAFAPILFIYSLLVMYIDNESTLDYLYSWGVLNAFQIFGIALLILTPVVCRIIKKKMPEHFVPIFQEDMNRVWNWWWVGFIGTILVYLFLTIYRFIENLQNIGLTWQLILMALCYAPFILMYIIHCVIKKEIIKYYNKEQEIVDKRISAKNREQQSLKARLVIAGIILREMTEFIVELNNKYSYMRSFYENLKIWYKENKNIKEIPLANKNPFISLANADCLNAYFNKKKEELTSEIKLYKLLEGYTDMSENGIIALKNTIKEKLKVELNNKTSDFSIFDHITGRRKFDYVQQEYVDIDQLMREMDANSQIFVRVSQRADDTLAQNTKCKMLFREAEDNAGARDWNNAAQNNFSIPPVSHDIKSKFKVFIIRLEGLETNEIVMLSDYA
ncbi:MAG: C1 family peptidase [Bacteroidaceae bacterium]|nr:C1 family peptidase [Bacteroidaceae bacterium]